MIFLEGSHTDRLPSFFCHASVDIPLPMHIINYDQP